MEEKANLTSDETLAQIFAISYKFAHDSTLNFIKLYDNKYKMLKLEMIKHEEKEPFKVFKKAHENWEIKKAKINLELEKTFNNLLEEYADLENLINLSTSSN